MSGNKTSFLGLFEEGASPVGRVRVPLIQRDYAQGREDPGVDRIRGAFVEALHAAVTGSEPLDLDFVFGEVSEGAFTPLDGQQRLTTLFLLHWYLAARSGEGADGRWRAFTYETRASARDFCEALGARVELPPGAKPSAWIRDQTWFLATWRGDPTVDGMLVTLDAVHARFTRSDAAAAWRRLADRANPAVTFHVLPIEGMGSADAFYVKMNSRGRPLTAFESFKARFEQALARIHRERAEAFARSVDGAWSDVLWDVRRPDDDVIDDEFLRYLHFVAEVSAWRCGAALEARGDIGDFVIARFTGPDAKGDELAWLFGAFDAWCAPAPSSDAFFRERLSFQRHEPGKVTLYAGRASADVDLFKACCQTYGERDGGARRFSYDRTLLLYAAVVHRIGRTADFGRRLRVLRNLIEASEELMTLKEMPALVADVARFVADGDLDGVKRLSPKQVREEREKAALRSATPALSPTLDALEDHDLLRGVLGAIDLSPQHIALRADAFARVFAPEVSREALAGALLACGDYARVTPDGTRLQLVPWRAEGEWRALFRRSEEPALQRLRDVLRRLLDGASAAAGTGRERVDAVCAARLMAREAEGRRDAVYYLAKYPAARTGRQGWYHIRDPRPGRYLLYMLEGVRMSGEFFDPYLRAVHAALGGDPNVEVAAVWGIPFDRQCLCLKRSRIEVRSAVDGFALKAPAGVSGAPRFDEVCARHAVGDGRLRVTQQHGLDDEDRVLRCAALVRDLVAAGY